MSAQYAAPPYLHPVPSGAKAETERPRLQTAWTAAELMAAEFPEPRWAVPGILCEGVNLLAGPPNVGKSWMSLGLGLSVASGQNAFDTQPVERGPVRDGNTGIQPRRDSRMSKVVRPATGLPESELRAAEEAASGPADVPWWMWNASPRRIACQSSERRLSARAEVAKDALVTFVGSCCHWAGLTRTRSLATVALALVGSGPAAPVLLNGLFDTTLINRRTIASSRSISPVVSPETAQLCRATFAPDSVGLAIHGAPRGAPPATAPHPPARPQVIAC